MGAPGGGSIDLTLTIQMVYNFLTVSPKKFFVCNHVRRRPCEGVSTKEIYMEIELSSHRREMLLFLTTNMAGVTSHANHQYKMSDKDFF